MAVKSIVLYYSLIGTTQQLANIIEKIAGSEKIVRIEEEVSYPKEKRNFTNKSGKIVNKVSILHINLWM